MTTVMKKSLSPYQIELDNAIRDIVDFPKSGIVFKDLTPVLLDVHLMRKIIDSSAAKWADKNIDYVAGIESRGYWFGIAIADKLGVPFIPIRKKGKLPGDKVEISYALEYGEAWIEMHRGHLKPGSSVLIHDDLLATGGTAEAAVNLIEAEKGTVAGFHFIVTLAFLGGPERLIKFAPSVLSEIEY